MSHFTRLKTKLKDKEVLIKALNTLSYSVEENVLLHIDGSHAEDHADERVELAVTHDVGFKLTKDGTFNLVAELDTWEEPFPIERFLEKVTQAYAKVMVVQTAQEQGYTVVSEQKSVDNTIEVVVEKW
jgi:hypothetical protein|tara:strand:- start:162 stop:545 length:384 start_codon:yes stop_codon:yes gene_type:complete